VICVQAVVAGDWVLPISDSIACQTPMEAAGAQMWDQYIVHFASSLTSFCRYQIILLGDGATGCENIASDFHTARITDASLTSYLHTAEHMR